MPAGLVVGLAGLSLKAVECLAALVRCASALCRKLRRSLHSIRYTRTTGRRKSMAARQAPRAMAERVARLGRHRSKAAGRLIRPSRQMNKCLGSRDLKRTCTSINHA